MNFYRDCYPPEYFGSFDGRFEVCRRARLEVSTSPVLTPGEYLTFFECMQLLNSEPGNSDSRNPRISIAKVNTR